MTDYIPSPKRYGRPDFYRRCGRSGLRLPAVSLGLWHNFAGRDRSDNAKADNGRAMIRKAFDLGITHFDLANNYGPPPGAAEENFGRIFGLDLAPHRDEIVISTKAGYNMWEGPYGDWGSRKYLLSSLDQSLTRLGINYVDIFYSHRPDPETPLEETMGALAQAVRSGKALYVGISNYDPLETAKSVDILHELGIPCLIHQPSYSLFDRWIESGLLDVLAETGVGCIAFSPLAQGLLTDKYLQGIPPGSRASGKVGFLRPEHVTADKVDRARRLNGLAQERGQSLAQFALSWVLRHPQMTSVLIGASTPGQIEENVAAAGKTAFTDAELRAIDSIVPPACTSRT